MAQKLFLILSLVLICGASNAQKQRSGQAQENQITVVVGEAKVNDVVSQGHLSGYMADMLVQQIRMNCPNVRVLDKELLKENHSETFRPQYQLNIVMQKPDVVNEANGSHVNAAMAYFKRSSVARLRAVVNMSVSVVEYESAAIKYQISESGTASGKRSVLSEMYVLGFGGGQGRNLGIDDYKQSLSGEAIREASVKLAENLRAWFNGEINAPAIDNTVNYVSYKGNQEMFRKGSNLYIGTNKVTKYDAQEVFANYPDLYFKYKSGKRMTNSAWWAGAGVFVSGFLLVGMVSESPNETYGGLGLTFVGTVGSIVGIKLLGKKKLSKVAAQYNEYENDLSYLPVKTKKESSVSLSLTPNGFCLNF